MVKNRLKIEKTRYMPRFFRFFLKYKLLNLHNIEDV